MSTKTCTRCNKVKDFSLFQKRAASKDGMTASCKECLSIYDKTRANLPHRVKARAEYQKTEAGMESSAKAKKRYIEKNPIKRAAHMITGSAIRKGDLIKKPCEVCGSIDDIHARHNDYHKPLEVRWLCSTHHNEWHKENGEGLNG